MNLCELCFQWLMQMNVRQGHWSWLYTFWSHPFSRKPQQRYKGSFQWETFVNVFYMWTRGVKFDHKKTLIHWVMMSSCGSRLLGIWLTSITKKNGTSDEVKWKWIYCWNGVCWIWLVLKVPDFTFCTAWQHCKIDHLRVNSTGQDPQSVWPKSLKWVPQRNELS